MLTFLSTISPLLQNFSKQMIIDTLTGKEMTNILMTLSNPNYFKHKGNFHEPPRRIATGSPVSGASWPKSLFC
jgi:hypothetical protein